MRLDKLLAMEAFTRVVETGSFTRSAQALRLPKATLTNLIQQLEASLGVRLLNRTTRRVSVTSEGAAYYERCAAILAQVGEADDFVTLRHATARGRMRVQAPTLMARLVIVPGLEKFAARYPQIEVELHSSERRVDLVEEGIDCAIWSGPLEDTSLVARPIGHLFVSTCAAPSYLARHGKPLHPDELARHPCIARVAPWEGVQPWVFERDTVRAVVTPRGPFSFDDENSYLAAAESGLGIAQIPAYVLKDAMERATLDFVLGEWNAEPLPIHVVYPQRRHLSAKIRGFVDWIVGFLGEHDAIQLRSTLPGRS